MTRLSTLSVTLFVPLALLATGPASAKKKVFSYADTARTAMVGQVAISPSGEHVAYVKYVPRTPLKDKDGGSWAELWVLDGKGKSRAFVTGAVNVRHVGWLPNGSAITFMARRGDDKETSLYQIAIDGGEASKLLSHSTSMTDYTFNGDGSRVAFLARARGSNGAGDDSSKGFDQEIYEEDRGLSEVWVATVGSKDDPKKLTLEGNASALGWSPVGDRLTVALAPSALIDDHYMKRKIAVVDVKTGKVTARIKNPGKLGSVVWSPDGKHVAAVSALDLNDPRSGRILVGDAKTGKHTILLADYKGHVRSIAWRGNGHIAFVADEGVYTTLGEIDIDSAETKIHINGGPVLRSLSLAKDGMSYATMGAAPDHPWEVYTGGLGKGPAQRQTTTNPWLKNRKLGKQEVVTWKARDGVELEGILIRPVGEKKGKRYPLIVAVHGGPESHVPNGWLTRYALVGQVAAGRGFAIFYPNYRGSTGRGVAFSKSSQAEPAGPEFDDLVDGVKHLVKTGLADKARVGIGGGSYGGYAAAWGATAHTEHYAAAVMFVGISNKVSKTGTTDIANEEFFVHSRKRPYGNWKFFLERSPIYHVEKARTPTLIVHGDSDPRVHPSQSMEMYRHLKVLGKAPVRLVFYKGEGHGNRRAASRLDLQIRMMRWYEHYLGTKKPESLPPKAIDYGAELKR